MKDAKDFTEEVRAFIRSRSFGLLSTFYSEEQGYPFGSLVKYIIDKNGAVFIYISLLAEHYKNLQVSNKASLFLFDGSNADNPLGRSRATLLLKFFEDANEGAKSAYLKQFPGDVPAEIQGNFKLYRGEVQKIRWIKGFGEMGWVSGDQFRS